MNAGLVKRRRAALALASAATLTGGLLGLSAPANAAGTHSVTVTSNPAQAGWLANLSCTGGATDYQDLATTNASGVATFANVPDGSSCNASVSAANYFVDPAIYLFSPSGPYTNGSTSTATTSSAITVTVAANTGFHCAAPTSVVGTPAVGQQVSYAAPATANGTEDPAKRRVFWMRLTVKNGHLSAAVAQGSTASDPNHYTVTEADLGYQLVAFEYATNNASPSSSAYCDWNPSSVVGRLGTPTHGRPGIRGVAKVGKKLRADAGTQPAGTVVSGYQWYIEKIVKKHSRAKVVLVKIKGAHRSLFKVRPALKGKLIVVGVTYSRASYNPTTVLSRAKRVK